MATAILFFHAHYPQVRSRFLLFDFFAANKAFSGFDLASLLDCD